MTRAAIVIGLWLVAAAAAAQPQRPYVADPHYAFEVTGTVRGPGDRRLAGVEILRIRSATDRRPYQRGGYRVRTAEDGAFRFRFSGIGTSGPRTWYLLARRRGCPDEIATVHLSTGVVDGREGDVARNVRISMPGCRLSPEEQGRTISSPQVPPTPPERSVPTRYEVAEAMRAIRPRVVACGDALRGPRMVRFEVRGESGEVVGAEIQGAAPEEVRACVRSVARGVHLRPFSRETFRFSFPFRFPSPPRDD